jgi:hypothetical protein
MSDNQCTPLVYAKPLEIEWKRCECICFAYECLRPISVLHNELDGIYF